MVQPNSGNEYLTTIWCHRPLSSLEHSGKMNCHRFPIPRILILLPIAGEQIAIFLACSLGRYHVSTVMWSSAVCGQLFNAATWSWPANIFPVWEKPLLACLHQRKRHTVDHACRTVPIPPLLLVLKHVKPKTVLKATLPTELYHAPSDARNSSGLYLVALILGGLLEKI